VLFVAIQKVLIENLTVFEKFNMEFSAGINVFIGENGTGKTHLLKFMYATLYGAKNSDGKEWTDLWNSIGVAASYFGTDTKALQRNDSIDRSLCEVTYNGKSAMFEIIPSISDKFKEEAFKYDNTDHALDETVNSLVFIPASEILSHSKGFLQLYQDKEIAFDKTYYDIVNYAQRVFSKNIDGITRECMKKLSTLIDGEVYVDGSVFYVKKTNGHQIPFSLEAEGLRKIGLLWTLLRNGTIKKGTVLFWDDPEANINPKLIPDLVEILLELSKQGVQIFISTHDYVLVKYFEVKSNNTDVIFHSLYKI